jgi:hypothetical protein
LVERLATTHGREKADLHAHIGWANFLRYRDGRPKTDIGEEFDAAIREDNLNGHVMRGFWNLWEGGPIEAASTRSRPSTMPQAGLVLPRGSGRRKIGVASSSAWLPGCLSRSISAASRRGRKPR